MSTKIPRRDFLKGIVIGNAYVRYETALNRLAMIEGKIREVFGQTFPDVERVTDPKAQLQAEVETARRQLEILSGLAPVGGATAVDVLRTIAASVSDSIAVDTDEYIMDTETVRIKAKTNSFEAVDTIKQQLLNAHYFADVQVKDVKSGQDGRVDFRLVLALDRKGRDPAALPR